MTTTPAHGISANEFLASVRGWMYTLANRYARRGLDPDDVYQAIAVLVVRRLHRYDPARSARTTWVAWQARSAVWRMLQKEPQHQTLSLDWRHAGGHQVEFASWEPDPADVATTADLVAIVRAAVDALPAEQRAAVLARHGMAEGDAGVRTSQTKALAKSGERRLLRSLRRCG